MNVAANTVSEPDVTFTFAFTIIQITPLTPAGTEWIEANVNTEPWQWLGATLNVEPRFASDILEAMRGDGLAIVIN